MGSDWVWFGSSFQNYDTNMLNCFLYFFLLSFQFSWSVVSNSDAHGLQHARFPCLSPTPGACLNSCPSTQWCHPTISSSVIPFSSRLQSFATSGSFPVSQLFISGGQSLLVQLQHQSFQWIFRVDVFLVYKQICWCLPCVCPDIAIGFDLVCLGRLIWIVFKLTWGNCVNQFIMILKALNRNCARY